MIEKAQEALEAARGELQQYTGEIANNVLNLAEYELKFKGAFNEENVGILRDFAFEMGLVDQNTFEVQRAMEDLFDPLNNLPVELKAEGMRSLNTALVENKSPREAYKRWLIDTALEEGLRANRYEVTEPRALAFLRGKYQEETPLMTDEIGKINTAYDDVQGVVKEITEETLPEITKVTTTMVDETIPQMVRFAQLWHANIITKLWETQAEIEKIGRLIAGLPTDKTITIHVNQVGSTSFATGGQFIVPPGFPNDTFPMNVSSGEKVTVTHAGMNTYTPTTMPMIDNNGRGMDADMKWLMSSIHSSLRDMPSMIGRSVRDSMRQ
jgi:hypothetical protein